MAKKLPPGFEGQKFVEITVDENGQTTIEAHNFHGVGCKEATKGLEQALGAVSKRTDKRGPEAKQTIRGGGR